jgi:hypothetical protein
VIGARMNLSEGQRGMISAVENLETEASREMRPGMTLGMISTGKKLRSFVMQFMEVPDFILHLLRVCQRTRKREI